MLKRFFRHINDHYGSKKGFVKYHYYRLLTLLGFYNRYRKIDWSRVDRLVYVCMGNICRSPLGEAYARHRGFNVISFGTSTKGDCPADDRAIAYAAELGIDMTPHRTSRMDQYDEKEGDLIIMMEPKHLTAVLGNSNGKAQMTLAPLWASKPNAYLHDPYGVNPVFFRRCEDTVIESADNIFRQAGKARLA